MPIFGVERRRRRLEGAAGRIFLLALDHGIAAGPISGIERPGDLVRRLRSAPFSGLVVSPGTVRSISADITPAWSLIVHLSAGTLLGSSPRSKVLASTVEHAVSLGADAVAVQISFGDSREDRMIADAGRVVNMATSLGLPVILMAYAPSDPGGSSVDPVAAGHAARAAAELGASIVQTNFAGSPDGLREIAQSCPVPLVVAGGPQGSTEDAFLDALRETMRAGAAGISVGRRVFQALDPPAVAQRIADVVFGGDRPLIIEAAR
jgi:DhnA family fructose-bisphosphate aldolase class Ia